MSLWTGTGVALVTPFTPDGALDLPALRRVVQHVTAGGVDFLVPLGTTAEVATISSSEQQQVIDTVLEVNAGRLPVLLGCGGNDTAHVAERLRQFDRAYAGRIQGYLTVSPYYNRPSQEGIFRHYCALAEATSLPIVLYNVPARTGCNVLPETVLRIARQCPSIVAVKEASGNLEQGMLIARDAPAGFSVLSGDDALALPGIAVGFTGVISVVANATPAPFATLIRQALAGDFASARAAHLALLPFIHLLFAEGNPAGVKAALHALELCGPHVRLPLAEATPALHERITAALLAHAPPAASR